MKKVAVLVNSHGSTNKSDYDFYIKGVDEYPKLVDIDNTGNLIINEYFKRQFSGLMDFVSSYDLCDVAVLLHANVLRPNILQGYNNGEFYSPQFVRSLKKPLCILGIGCQPEQPEMSVNEYIKTLDAKIIDLMHAYSEKTNIIGTRGEFTSEVLWKLKIDSEPLGCPSWYVNLDLQKNIIKKDFSYDLKPVFSFKKLPIFYYEYLAKEVFKFADKKYILQDECQFLPYKNFYESKKEYMKYGSLKLFNRSLSYIAKQFNVKSSSLLQSNDWKKFFTIFFDVKKWDKFMQNRDFFFGSRIHSSIIAIKNSIPAFPIACDGRISELCSTFALPYVTLSDLHKKKADIRDIYEAVDFSEMNKRYPKLLEAYRSFLRKNGLELA